MSQKIELVGGLCAADRRITRGRLASPKLSVHAQLIQRSGRDLTAITVLLGLLPLINLAGNRLISNRSCRQSARIFMHGDRPPESFYLFYLLTEGLHTNLAYHVFSTSKVRTSNCSTVPFHRVGHILWFDTLQQVRAY